MPKYVQTNGETMTAPQLPTKFFVKFFHKKINRKSYHQYIYIHGNSQKNWKNA